jgi:hypothetical protein
VNDVRAELKIVVGHRINNIKGLLARPLYGSDVDPVIDAIADYLDNAFPDWDGVAVNVRQLIAALRKDAL